MKNEKRVMEKSFFYIPLPVFRFLAFNASVLCRQGYNRLIVQDKIFFRRKAHVFLLTVKIAENLSLSKSCEAGEIV